MDLQCVFETFEAGKSEPALLTYAPNLETAILRAKNDFGLFGRDYGAAETRAITPERWDRLGADVKQELDRYGSIWRDVGPQADETPSAGPSM